MAQKHILISGSREINSDGLEYARKCVRRAKEIGAMIVVGDNPKGIDAAVIDEADRVGCDIVVFGAYGKHRKVTIGIKGTNRKTTLTYSKRDEKMVGSVSKDDVIVCIWNGTSKGTKHVYDASIAKGLNANLKQF